jgi:serine/threonine-protein kinase
MIPDLIARMGGKDPVIKIHLMNLLTQFDKPEIDHALEMQLKDPNKMVRSAALESGSRPDGPGPRRTGESRRCTGPR